MPRQKRKNPAVWEEGSDVELEMPGPAQEDQADRPFPPTVTHRWKTYHAEMETFKVQHAILEEQKEKQRKKDRKRRRAERAAEREKKMAAENAERNAMREAAKIEKKKKKDEENAAKEERKAARAAKAAANRAEKEAKRQVRADKAAAKAAARAAEDNDEDEDDQQDEEDDETVSETEDEQPTPVKRAPIRRPAKRRKTGPFIDDSETETEAEPIQPARLPAFLRLPLEIREQIYIYLLAPDTDSRLRVQVCNGWTEPLLGRAHRQLRSQLHPAIMRVNSQIADECVKVLYGRNEFEYCLRDPSTESAEAQEEEEAAEAADETIDADDADDADDDFEGTDEEPETESDDDYEEPEPRRKTRANPRHQPASQPAAAVTRAAAAPYDAFDPSVSINVRKFGHHYRRIRIRAEPGRSSPAYRTAMAQAIRVFTALEPRRARLHTLTLEITPQRDPDDENHISFIDFFDPKGEVISAMRLLPCQFIRVLVHTELPSPETGLCETEIVLDLRHAASMRRARRGERDVWQGDCVAMEVRQRKATMEQRRMLSLQKLILQQWEKQELWVDELGRPITREQYEVELAEAEDDWFWD